MVTVGEVKTARQLASRLSRIAGVRAFEYVGAVLLTRDDTAALITRLADLEEIVDLADALASDDGDEAAEERAKALNDALSRYVALRPRRNR